MTSGVRLDSIKAFPLMRVTESLLKSWPVGSLSSHPFFLASAAPSFFTWPTAVLWRPPKVSRATGRKVKPCVLQASAVSLILRSKAFVSALPASLAATVTLVGASGLVTVTSSAASLPSHHLRMRISPGLAAVPGMRWGSSLEGPRSALAAAS